MRGRTVADAAATKARKDTVFILCRFVGISWK